MKIICQECGAEVEGNEYHPYAFCLLIKAGIDPVEFVCEAVRKLGLLNAWEPAPDEKPEG